MGFARAKTRSGRGRLTACTDLLPSSRLVSFRVGCNAHARCIDPDRVVSADETGASTKVGRPHGYGPRGEPAVGAVPLGHWKLTTFAAGLRASGVVASVASSGPFAAYIAYVEQ